MCVCVCLVSFLVEMVSQGVVIKSLLNNVPLHIQHFCRNTMVFNLVILVFLVFFPIFLDHVIL